MSYRFSGIPGAARMPFLLLLLCLAMPALAFDTLVQPTIVLTRFASENVDIKVDGVIDEPVWQTLTAYDHFRVLNPDTMAEVPYETRLRAFYTEKGLYVSVWAEQPPDTLIARLSSRDQFIGRDGITITIDTSGEGLYGYWFGINLGGSLSDGTVLPERQFSNRWDGAWRGASAEHEAGYSVEYFLPFSMMTLPEQTGDVREFGLYISRRVAHKGEFWGWPSLPPSRSLFMSSLQPLQLDNFEPSKQFTFYPYASTSYDVIESEDNYKAGFDVFWRPSSNLQLTATVNPDFGNVESDDVVVNLTSFETFFPEKRPFFLEGQEIFQTTPRARGRGGSPVILVHTRRIGGPPESVDVDDLSLSDLEANQPSELEAAAKITGQKGNWRYGAMIAEEDETKIEGTLNGMDVDLYQEGRTFGTTRVLYETTNIGARSGLGWIATLVDHPDKDAIVQGIDAHYLSRNGAWNFDGQLLFSDVDDERGSGGFFDLSYTPRQGLKHELALDYYDDELNINDFGYLRRNDAISARYALDIIESDLEHLKLKETGFRVRQEYNTDGRVVRSGLFFFQERVFKNNSFLFTELNYFPSRWEDLESDGNGEYKIDHRWQTGAFWASDNAKPLQLGVGFFIQNELIGGNRKFYETEINWRPTDRFSMRLFLSFQDIRGWLLHEGGRDFTTFRTDRWQPRLEVNYFFSARQQLKLSAQWVGIKADEQKRWQVPLEDGTLLPDQRPAVGNRDFSISSLSFQARYRWELAPLSDLFIVYTRGSDIPSRPQDSFSDLLRASWTERAADSLVIKLRYRLGS